MSTVTLFVASPQSCSNLVLLRTFLSSDVMRDTVNQMRVVKVDEVDRFIIKSGNLIVAARDGKSSPTSDEHGKTY